MTKPKRVYCDWCGEDIGESVVMSCYREPESCGKPECEREIRRALAAERSERAWAASDDDYERCR